MKILLTSVGRRGYLVKFFKEAVNNGDEIWGGDNSLYAPAFHYCDNCVLLPRVTDTEYIDKLITYCRKNQIDIVIPLIDPELEILAAQRDRFYAEDIMVVISPLKTVEIAFDKYLTYTFGKENRIAVPETVITLEDAKELLVSGKLKWPVVVKPRKGSASADITYCHNENQLKAAFESCPMPMIQEFLDGQEYGYDIFADRDFKPVSVYCKKKLVMRAGETDKAISTAEPELIGLGEKLASNLQLFGPMDVDVIVTDRVPKLLELNPRFGGGYPCSHLCGADFPAKLIAIRNNESITPDIGSYPEGVCMLKQDEIIYMKDGDIDSIK